MIREIEIHKKTYGLTLETLVGAIIIDVLEGNSLNKVNYDMLHTLYDDFIGDNYLEKNEAAIEAANDVDKVIRSIKANTSDSRVPANTILALIKEAYKSCKESYSEEEYARHTSRLNLITAIFKDSCARVRIENDEESVNEITDETGVRKAELEKIPRELKVCEELKKAVIHKIANGSNSIIIVYGRNRCIVDAIVEDTIISIMRKNKALKVMFLDLNTTGRIRWSNKLSQEETDEIRKLIMSRDATRQTNIFYHDIRNDDKIDTIKKSIEDEMSPEAIHIIYHKEPIDGFDCVDVSRVNVKYEDMEGFSSKVEKCTGMELTEAAEKMLFNCLVTDDNMDAMKVIGYASELLIAKGSNEKLKIDKEEMVDALNRYLEEEKESVAKKCSKREKIDNTERLLSKSIFGQQRALDDIMRAVKIAEAGLKEKDKPLASLMFVGPTGTGKTETAKKLAEASGMEFVRIDMGEYSEQTAVGKFLGTAPGYVGYNDGSALEKAMKGKDKCVILFDEIEKAHGEVFDAMMQILDNGEAKDGHSKVINFRDSIIIMTSNAGASDLSKNSLGFMQNSAADERNGKGLSDCVDKSLRSTFKPEFINRLDSIVQFEKLNKDVSRMIAGKLIKELAELAGTAISIDDEALDELASKGCDINFGAREIKRVINKEITDKLAEIIIDTDGATDATYRISFSNNEFIINKENFERDFVVEKK